MVIASGTLAEQVIQLVPECGDVILSAWPARGLARSFTEEQLDAYLAKFNVELPRRRRGAWNTFFSVSEDAVAQASHSMRDILANIISKEASNDKIERCTWYKARKTENPETKPSIMDRIRLLLGEAARLRQVTEEF